MTDNWKEITDPEELFKLKREGWEIEVMTWNTWSSWNGATWDKFWKFRARPHQPKMKKVKLEAWLSEYELRWLNVAAGNKPAPLWIHIPEQDIEIEVPE